MDSITPGERARVLVLGLGNILLSDEGIGVHVVRELQERPEGVLPASVEVADGGTAGLDLLDLIADREKLIVIDAADIAGPPGSVVRLAVHDLAEQHAVRTSLHEIGLPELLSVADLLGHLPGEIVIFAVKPQSLAPGLELTPTLRAALPLIASAVLTELYCNYTPAL